MKLQFSKQSIRGISIAQQSAVENGAVSVTTLHLLSGILRVENSNARRLVVSIKDDAEALAMIPQTLPSSVETKGIPPTGDEGPQLSSLCKSVLQAARVAASAEKHDLVLTEDILLAFFDAGDNLATQSLTSHGLRKETLLTCLKTSYEDPGFDHEETFQYSPETEDSDQNADLIELNRILSTDNEG